MSEVQSRPAASRGRGSGRGGRGGFSSRGGARASNRSAPATNGDSKYDVDDASAFEEDPDTLELRKLYGSKTGIIKEMFPDWTETDILFALKETDGDESLTVTRIAEGSISQWGEVSKQKKDRTRSKAKDTFTTTTGVDAPVVTSSRPARGGRNASEGGRGRGRATERGGRGARGRSSAATTNGARTKENQPLSVPTEESHAWDGAKPDEETSGWDTAASSDPAQSAAAATSATPASGKSTVIPEGSQKTWASMLRQSTAPKSAPKPKDPIAPNPEPVLEHLPPPEIAQTHPEPEQPATEKLADTQHQPAPVEIPTVVVPEVALPPSKDQLTETNLEQVIDESHPPVTETTHSEAADSWDPRAAIPVSNTATPLSASQHQHQAARGPASGFAASAIKATERGAVRTPSFARKILEQEEAVRMPGNREVDRAAVQFGAFSLNGGDDDIDGDREEPETRAQPPGDSPIAHPRTSLPPVTQAAPVPDAFSAQKQSASLQQATAPNAIPTAPAAQQAPVAQGPQQLNQPSAQYGRFGQNGPQDPPPFSQKPFDAYGPQATQSSQSQYDGFPSQQQAQAQTQNQQPSGAFSSAPSEYSSYYTADQQNRGPYNYYNQQYGQQQQQGNQGQQEGGLPSTGRSFGGYGGPQADMTSQYPQSSNQSRFGAGSGADVQGSGSTTPNPPGQGQQQGAQSAQPQSQGQQQQQQQQQQQHGSQYPYTHPYYSSPYYAAYMNQYGYGQGGFGGPYGKGNVYGQPHQYGMSPQAPYDHSSSPATGYGQSSLHRADSGLGSGLSDYGRAGSAQSGSQQGLGGSGFSGVHDTFGRGPSSYQSQPGQSFNAPTSQPGVAPASNDDLKPFGDTKGASGPSPSLGGAARPGSATNNTPSQSGLPPPQSGQSGVGMGGYGGYPSQLQSHGLHGNQSGTGGYGAGGGAGQGHQSSPYGGYGSQGFGGSYYGNQPRGWGGNYH